jgi:hypothetical protein
MGGTFATSDAHARTELKPLRVPIRKQDVYAEARNLASELPGWRILAADDARLVLTCERRRGPLGGTSTITLSFEGPAEMPSTIVNAVSVSAGGFPGFARDRANILEFMRPFHRRVC